jgi:DNA repair protein RAD16
VLDELLLRRTKENRADDIELPPRVVRVRKDHMDEFEDDFYQALYTQSKAEFNTYVEHGTVLNNYAHIFDILIRLRQAADHPYLVIYNQTNGTGTHGDAGGIRSSADRAFVSGDAAAAAEVCGLCDLPADQVAVRAACGCLFCRRCMEDVLTGGSGEGGGAMACPKCDAALTVNLTQSVTPGIHAGGGDANGALISTTRTKKSIMQRIDPARFQTSTKMEALMEELSLMQKRDPGAKAIVFSQFVTMLDLLEHRISTIGGIKCVKLRGNMTLEQRDVALKRFNNDADCKVFLISLKAGGVALNLTVANYSFIMDPWWNPAAEFQAIDRTHRIGQHRPIKATRFIIADSIEERILQLQEKKRLVFDGTVGGDAASMVKLTEGDMHFLFH